MKFLRPAALAVALSLSSAVHAAPAMAQRDTSPLTPCDYLIMAMENVESLQAYLQGLINLGGTTTDSRPKVQAIFTAMDGTVNDINGIYTTLPSCKPASIDDEVVMGVASGSVLDRRAGSPCTILTADQAKIDDIQSQTVTIAAAETKLDLSPLKAKLDAAKGDLKQAVAGFISSGICGKE